MAETLKKPFVALLFVLFLGAIFRFMLISDLPPGLYPDEAMNGNNALEALRNTNLSAKNGPSFGWKIFYPENNGREGLFINIQALSVYTFGNTAWALRIVSSLFGTLTILGLYLVAKELFWGIQTPSRDISERKKKVIHPHLNMYNPGAIALFAAFFIATNYWHINFSRIGFRAIMLPLVCTFGFYWLLKALRTGKISSAVLGGIIFGLGFHTYIAFRIAPLVIAFVVLWYSWLWWKERGREAIAGVTKTCAPCILALFLFATFVTALPIGYYFLQHRGDLVGRQTQVSVFGSDNPVKALALSTIKTFGMFNIIGDCNQRHNYKCKPELFWPVGFFFLLGFIASLLTIIQRTFYFLRLAKSPFHTRFLKGLPSDELPSFPLFFLFVWFASMMLPAVLTTEGIPHALRSIGLIPPVFIFSSLGVFFLVAILLEQLESRFSRASAEGPASAGISPTLFQKFVSLLLAAVFFFTAVHAYTTYFTRFAKDPETYSAFAGDLYAIGRYAASLPPSAEKYIVVNMSGVETRGIPMPAQPIMFATDTFTEAGQKEKKLSYVLLQDIKNLRSRIPLDTKKPVFIIPLNKNGSATIAELKKEFPGFRVLETADFVAFTNTPF